MLLRNVELTDVEAYVAMRCDPVMMAELGGPQPRVGIEPKVSKDVADAAGFHGGTSTDADTEAESEPESQSESDH